MSNYIKYNVTEININYFFTIIILKNENHVINLEQIEILKKFEGHFEDMWNLAFLLKVKLFVQISLGFWWNDNWKKLLSFWDVTDWTFIENSRELPRQTQYISMAVL